MYKYLVRPLLFLLPAESAHHFALTMLKVCLKLPFMKALTSSVFSVRKSSLHRSIFGLSFPNPVGLAAGFDKNARYVDELSCLGFGFIEIGTVTPLPQPGNDKPRLFRLPKDGAVINRMGFNNDGVEKVAARLKNRKSNIIIGGNIGKNKITPNENAEDDYVKCFEALFAHVDYFAVNVSSPNTPGLRELQEKAPLLKILHALQARNNQKSNRKPILLKIAPDLTDAQLDDIIEIVTQTKIDGIIATNTTVSRDNLKTSGAVVDACGTGGLSGASLHARSTEVIRYLHQKARIPIIGVGGIMAAKDAEDKLKAGASLVQVYTGFIYEGPSLAGNICKHLPEKS